jgi:hypothetical protein
MGLLYLWMSLGNENPASLQRRTMLDKQVVGVTGFGDDETLQAEGQKVCYLYSEADKMCDWRDIRKHADDARLAGFQVQEIIFVGSSHCSHLSKDEARYSEAIRNIWADTRGLDTLSKL